MHSSETPAIVAKRSVVLGWGIGVVCGILVAVAALQGVDGAFSRSGDASVEVAGPAAVTQPDNLRALDTADTISTNAMSSAGADAVQPLLVSPAGEIRSMDVADMIAHHGHDVSSPAGSGESADKTRMTDAADTIDANRALSAIDSEVSTGPKLPRTRH